MRDVAIGVIFVILVMPVAANEPSLGEVLRRAGEYVARYHEAMTSVIAEERYVQTWSTADSGATPVSTTRRTLVSDFVVISGYGHEPRWMSFRDVLEVDGVPVRERDGRLLRIFATASDAVDRASALSLESSRYNIGPKEFLRTINTPILAIDFLLPETRRRFSFHRRKGPDDRLWLIEYEERDKPTVIRTPLGQSVQSRGSFRIDPADGRVAESTLRVMGDRALITVSYEVDRRLQIAVPSVMSERYEFGKDLITGDATYTNYRRFETGVRIIPK